MIPTFERNFRDTSNKGHIISTIKTDERPEMQYETAIVLPGNIIKAVETYATLEESEVGHKKWLEIANKSDFDIKNHKNIVDNFKMTPLQAALATAKIIDNTQ